MPSLKTCTPSTNGCALHSASYGPAALWPSPNAPHGFTLVETMVTLGIFALIAGLAVGLDAHALRDQTVHANADTLAELLRTARTEAMSNLHEQPHGVAIRPNDHPNAFVTFEGASYATSDTATRQVTDVETDVAASADSPPAILFCPLSGVAALGIAPGTRCDDPRSFFDGAITLSDTTTGARLVITLNHEGAISQ